MIGKVRFDPEADAAYIRLVDGKIDSSTEIADGLIIDWSEGDEPLGLEVLYVAGRVRGGDVESYVRVLAEGLFAKRLEATE